MSRASETIRALLIEDNPGDTRLIREMLRDAGGGAPVSLSTSDRLSGGLERLAVCNVAALVVREAVQRAGIEPADVGHVVFGNVIHTDKRDMYCVASSRSKRDWRKARRQPVRQVLWSEARVVPA